MGVLSQRALLRAIRTARRRGERIVFTNGCFDLLHAGHIRLLEFARARGDRLIVGLNTDRSVRRLKGKNRPLQPQRARAAVLAAIRYVDWVCLFGDDTPQQLIRAVQPDVLVKGSDYRSGDIVGADVVRRRGGRVVRCPLVKGVSTTQLAKKIIRR